MPARDALVVGSFLALVGVGYLAITTNLLGAALAAATIVIYIFGYTPLKRISTTNTLVGAVPGALPPMIGWAAARGDIGWPAWSLFAILFCWQMPHFYAIGWMYREDYARAGFQMLSSRDVDGARSSRQSVLFAGLLIVASIWPTLLHVTGPVSFGGELFLGALFLAVAVRFWRRRTAREARTMFIASIIYLPLALAVLVITKL
jgi:protoheme IX farnesyltransferase